MGLPRFWVNTASLSLLVADTDFAYRGVGPDIQTTRTYNSNTPADTATVPAMFGNGWSFTYDTTVTETCMGAAVTRGEGGALFFSGSLCPSPNPGTVLSPPEGNFDRLEYLRDETRGINYWLYENKKSHLRYRYEYFSGAYRLMSITDRNGMAVGITRNADGLIQRLTDASGRSTLFAYDTGKRCVAMTTPNGRSATYEYDGSGNLVKSVDLAGNATTFAYDSDKYLTTMILGDKVTRFAYDAGVTPKRILSVTDALGNTQAYQRSAANETRTTDALANSAVYRADEKGKTVATVDALGASAGSKTFSAGLLAEYASPGGWTRSFGYDSRGNIISSSTSSSYGTGQDTTTFGYDSNDNLVSMTDPENASWVWRYEYDASGNRTRVVRPSGNSTRYGYSNGLVTTVTDAKGKTTTFSYDVSGNSVSTRDPLGNTSFRTYDGIGNMLTETDPAGNRTSYQYDANRRITRITHADNTFRTFNYDCCSLLAMTDENGRTWTTTRNGLLRPVTFADPLGNVTAYTYDANNTVVSARRPDNSTVTMTPDKLGRPSVITDALGHATTFTYDGDWNLASLTDERGNTTDFYFDHGRPAVVTEPQSSDPQALRNRLITSWDRAGRLKNWINSRYSGLIYTYTPDGQIASKSNYYPEAPIASYAYDSVGDMVQMNDPWGTTSFGYDDARRPTSITYPTGKQVVIAYGPTGRVTSMTYPTGVTVAYQHDNRNRVRTMTFDGQSITFSYDGVGNVISENRSNGASTTYTHDQRNLVAGISHARGGTVFSQASYTRDAMGNITRESGTQPLRAAILPSSVSAGFNHVNQVTFLNSDQFSYDADGNLTGISGSRPITATYDNENRLATITRGGVTTTYTYDGKGQRVRAVAGSSVANFHYDPQGRMIFQTNGSGQVTASYFYSGRKPVAMSTPAGGYYFYHYDKAGNCIAMTSAEGNVAAAYAYSPFGERTMIPANGGVANPFTYAGAFGVMDDGGGIYHMTTRAYDAVTGRFMQKDPAGFIGGTNLYAYAGNNPLVRVDPGGFDDEYVVNVMEGTADLNTGELPVFLNSEAEDQEIFDTVGAVAEVGGYLGDKAMNYAPERPGTFYSLGKACYNLFKYPGNEGRARAVIELTKMAIGSYYGATYGLAADLYQDALEGEISYLKKRAEQIPDDNPRWGKIGRIDY